MTARFALPAFALLVATPAWAGQSRSAQEFAGTYDLSCKTASLWLHVALSGGTAAGSGSWSDDLEVPLDCDGFTPDEEVAFAESLAESCASTGLPELACLDVAEDIAASIAAFNHDAVALLPSTLKTNVGSYGWFWSGLGGLYPMTGWHTFSTGTRAWTYLLDNNDGYARGHFAAAGLAVNDAGAVDRLACADVAMAAIDGYIRAGALDAHVAVDRSLTCLASDGIVWISGNIGIAYDANIVGAKR